MSWLRRGSNSILISFVMLALIGGWAIRVSTSNSNERLYRSQVRVCKATQVVALEANAQTTAHLASKSVLLEFLTTASRARAATGKAADRATAARLEASIDTLNTKVRFRKIPAIDCRKIIEKP